MKKAALALLLLVSPAMAQAPAAPPPAPPTTTLTVTAGDIQVFVRAMQIASKLCDAENQDACQIGLAAPSENAKFVTALQALQTKAPEIKGK
jgi:hypothetical protein